MQGTIERPPVTAKSAQRSNEYQIRMLENLYQHPIGHAARGLFTYLWQLNGGEQGLIELITVQELRKIVPKGNIHTLITSLHNAGLIKRESFDPKVDHPVLRERGDMAIYVFFPPARTLKPDEVKFRHGKPGQQFFDFMRPDYVEDDFISNSETDDLDPISKLEADHIVDVTEMVSETEVEAEIPVSVSEMEPKPPISVSETARFSKTRGKVDYKRYPALFGDVNIESTNIENAPETVSAQAVFSVPAQKNAAPTPRPVSVQNRQRDPIVSEMKTSTQELINLINSKSFKNKSINQLNQFREMVRLRFRFPRGSEYIAEMLAQCLADETMTESDLDYYYSYASQTDNPVRYVHSCLQSRLGSDYAQAKSAAKAAVKGALRRNG